MLDMRAHSRVFALSQQHAQHSTAPTPPPLASPHRRYNRDGCLVARNRRPKNRKRRTKKKKKKKKKNQKSLTGDDVVTRRGTRVAAGLLRETLVAAIACMRVETQKKEEEPTLTMSASAHPSITSPRPLSYRGAFAHRSATPPAFHQQCLLVSYGVGSFTAFRPNPYHWRTR